MLTKLQPEKYFSDEAKADLRPGDSIEICSEATSLTRDLCNIIELSRGMGLIIDYGEDHGFSNSFRGIKNHKLVKDDAEILAHAGNIDLTAYVNFRHIAEVAKAADLNVSGVMPQGYFLEAMGIYPRVEVLQKKAKSQKMR